MSRGLLVRTSIRPPLVLKSERRSLQHRSIAFRVLLVGLWVMVLLASPHAAIAQPGEPLALNELEAVHVSLRDATGLLATDERRALEQRVVERLRTGGLRVPEEEPAPTLVFTVEQATREQGWHRLAVLVELIEPVAPRKAAWKARASKVFSARAFERQQAFARLLDEQAAYVLSQSGRAPAISSEQ